METNLKTGTGILVFFIARILQMILTPLFFIYAIFSIRCIKGINKYFHSVAFGIDQLGNIMGAPIMNDVLLKKDAIKLYGDPDETISHVTGVNYMSNKLTIFGKGLAKILNFVDKGHVEKAANNNQ